jgi:hypothetical protein
MKIRKCQVYLINQMRIEEFKRYFTSSTPLGSTITFNKIIGSSHPNNMHMYPEMALKHYTKFQVYWRLTDKWTDR